MKSTKSKTVAAWPAPRFPGKTFVLASSLEYRDGVKQFIKEEGGRIVRTLTPSVDYLILGYPRGNKKPPERKLADELNRKGAAIQCLGAQQFFALLLPSRDEALLLLGAGKRGRERWQALWNSWNDAQTTLDLSGLDFRRKRLAHCNFFAVNFHGADFRGADLTDCCLRDLHDVQFDGARLREASFSEASNCSFKKADLTEAQINPAVFTDCDFTEAVLAELGGPYSQMTGCVFRKADLRRAVLEESKLQNLNFTGANLSGATLSKCDFTGATLAGAKLVGADLTDAVLAGADLTKANLTDAVLVNADLTGATIDGANFTGTTLTGVRLGSLDPSRAKGLDPAGAAVGGKVGPNIRELEKVARNSRRLETTAIIDLPKESVTVSLTSHQNGRWIGTLIQDANCGYHDYTNSFRDGMIDVTKKLVRGNLRLDAITVKCSKGPMKAKELKELAVRAWCEAMGVEPPSAEAVQQELDDAKRQRDDLRQKLLAELRGGAKGVARWNRQWWEARQAAAPFRGVDLSGANLSGVDLSGDFSNREDWQGAIFDQAVLAKADLDRCDLRQARFRNADLRGVVCRFSKVSGADFTGADLRKAHLNVSTFCGTIFHNADLRGADFGCSDLRGADLSSANLEGTTFGEARYNAQTRFPPGFVPPADMKWMGPKAAAPGPRGKRTLVTDFATFVQYLSGAHDPARLAKALKMLQADRFRLFADLDENSLIGVVKSQTDKDLVYSCRLASDGSFGCCTQNLRPCGGLGGLLCKHLLVLLIGLTKASTLDPATAQQWVEASRKKQPSLDKDRMSETFLKYKGAEAGEVDWRPAETLPEDYYAL
jgi:uncharacterized protein YjbI with pentapeptide repeats